MTDHMQYYVVVAGQNSHPRDRNIAGRYLIEIKPEVPAHLIASAVLDVFHAKIAIDVLDDFDITVQTMTGEIIAEDEAYDSSSLAMENSGCLIGMTC